MPAPTATPTAPPVNLASTQSYIIGFGIAAIVVIVIIGAIIGNVNAEKTAIIGSS